MRFPRSLGRTPNQTMTVGFQASSWATDQPSQIGSMPRQNRKDRVGNRPTRFLDSAVVSRRRREERKEKPTP